MDIELTKVNRQEILKYLGYRGSEITKEINDDIDDAINQIKMKSNPKYTYRVFNIVFEDKLILEDTNFELIGEDIREMLKECERCILLAATLGIDIDRLIKIYEKKDFSKSIIMDSSASSLIESLCNQINDELEEKFSVENLYLTDRFSPGYGDFPISSQNDFLNVLDAQKTIGLNTNSSGIMIPRKSVTAIIGISNKKQKKRFSGCENCSMFMNCEYRKSGITCGRE